MNVSGHTEDHEVVEGEVEDKEEALMAAMRAPLRMHRPVAGWGGGRRGRGRGRGRE